MMSEPQTGLTYARAWEFVRTACQADGCQHVITATTLEGAHAGLLEHHQFAHLGGPFSVGPADFKTAARKVGLPWKASA
jgi:hypothetical protein